MKKPTDLLSDASWKRILRIIERNGRQRAMEYSDDDIKRGRALVVFRFTEALCELPRGLPDAELTIMVGEVGRRLCESLVREGEYEQRQDANRYMNAMMYGRDHREFAAALDDALRAAGREDIVRGIGKGIGLA